MPNPHITQAAFTAYQTTPTTPQPHSTPHNPNYKPQPQTNTKMAPIAATKSTFDLIKEAIVALKERNGSSPQAIKAWLAKTYPSMKVQPHLIKAAFKQGVKTNKLVMVRTFRVGVLCGCFLVLWLVCLWVFCVPFSSLFRVFLRGESHGSGVSHLCVRSLVAQAIKHARTFLLSFPFRGNRKTKSVPHGGGASPTSPPTPLSNPIQPLKLTPYTPQHTGQGFLQAGRGRQEGPQEEGRQGTWVFFVWVWALIFGGKTRETRGEWMWDTGDWMHSPEQGAWLCPPCSPLSARISFPFGRGNWAETCPYIDHAHSLIPPPPPAENPHKPHTTEGQQEDRPQEEGHQGQEGA